MNITGCITTGFKQMVAEDPLLPLAGVVLLIGSAILALKIFVHTVQLEAPLRAKDRELMRDGQAPEHPERSPTIKNLERLSSLQLRTVAALILDVAVTCGAFYYRGCLKKLS
jgi:hypothetical protein